MANKTIKLGVREFTIPELAFRQRRIVTPLSVKISKDLKERVIDHGRKLMKSDFTEENYTDMGEVVFQGISRGAPKIEREEFLGFVFDLDDLLIAYYVVLEQNGNDMSGASSGEAGGEAAPNFLPTGMNTLTI